MVVRGTYLLFFRYYLPGTAKTNFFVDTFFIPGDVILHKGKITAITFNELVKPFRAPPATGLH